ncbi:MAG: ParA family protein [Sphingobacteriia bacterium]|nr:ParA family protein [Sphingobacteriia bacterium]
MLPHVITLATSKGGTGKSSLARSIAGYYFQRGFKVAVVDADPQGSIINRHSEDGPLKDLCVVAEPEEIVDLKIEELKENYNPIIVDTPGFSNKTTVKALVASDLVIVPLKPSADDLVAAIETIDLINEINETKERKGNPIIYRLVITMSQQGTIIAKHVRKELEVNGYGDFLLQAEMYLRVAYPETGINGLSPCVTDPNGAASRDIAAIMKEITKLKK